MNQLTETNHYVYNTKGVKYPLIPNPFNQARLGLAQSVSSLCKSVVVKAMCIAFIRNHDTREYVGDDSEPHHVPKDYGEHV